MTSRLQLGVTAVLAVSLARAATAQSGGGFDYLTTDYVDNTTVYTSQENTGSLDWDYSTVQGWTPPNAESATHLSVIFGVDKSNPIGPLEGFRVNVWSSWGALLADPFVGDALSETRLLPDTGSFTSPIGFNSVGSNYLIGFDLPDLPLVSGQTYYFGVMGLWDITSDNFGPVESSALANSGIQVINFQGAQGWQFTEFIGGTSFNGTLAMRLETDVLHTPWTDLAGGVPGWEDVTPLLAGVGNLGANEPYEVNLTDARPNTTAALVLGLSQLSAPFKGGVLVPAPDVLVAGLPTGPEGAIPLASTWPPGVPPGTSLWFQWWVTDPDGPVGFAASNGLQATAP